MKTIEIRCPVGPRRLLSKVISEGGTPHITGNLIEFACDDCKRYERKSDPDVVRVLHRFDLAGSLVESLIVFAGEDPEVISFRD